MIEMSLLAKDSGGEKHPIVHLAIDVQSRYLNSLSPERKNEFPRAVRDFADRLREQNIPTIWVALLKTFRFHSRRAVWSAAGAERRQSRQLEKFDLLNVAAREDEEVFIKKTNNAFEKLLADRLKDYHTTTLIITGMNTRYCVAATVFGGISEGLRCLIVSDLLADMSVNPHLDADPLWHRRTVESSLSKIVRRQIKDPKRQISWVNRAEFYTSREVLAAKSGRLQPAKNLADRLCGRRRLIA